MKVLQAWFLSRVAREKMLLLAFVLLGVAIWASSLLGRGQVWYGDFAATRAELDDQAFWLGRRASIEEAAKRDRVLARGINTYKGTVPHQAVAQALNVEHTPLNF